MFLKVCSLFLVLSLSTILAYAEERMWTSASGASSVKAEMVRLEGNKVYLRRLPDGRQIAVQLSQLSKHDRTYALQQATPDAPPETPFVSSTATGDPLDHRMQQLAKAYSLATINGLPIVKMEHLTLDMSDADTSSLARFLELVAFGQDENYFEECGVAFVYYYFPKQVFERYASGRELRKGIFQGGWKGHDEFERRASKEGFLKAHSADLQQMAIALPIRLAIISKVYLDSYDFTRQGLWLDTSPWRGSRTDEHWSVALPRLPANQRNGTLTRLNVVGPPTRTATFWNADPTVVKSLPSESGHPRPGAPPPVRRWAYYGAVVTLRPVPHVHVAEKDLPLIVADVDSLALYADEGLTRRLAEFPVQRFPASVLGTSVDAMLLKKGQTIPFDELAILALQSRELPQSVDDAVWDEMWSHVHRLDHASHLQVGKRLAEEGDAEHVIARNGSANPYHRSGLSAEETNAIRIEAEQTLEQARDNADDSIQATQRPFFPPGADAAGQLGNGRTLKAEQRQLLQQWLSKRIQRVDNRFTLLATIQQRTDQQEQAPTLTFERNGNRGALPAEIAQVLAHRGDSTEQAASINRPISLTQFGIDDRYLRTNLFRSPGELRTAPYLRFPVPIDSLLSVVPPALIEQALGKRDVPMVVELGFEINRVEFLDISQGRGGDAMLLHAAAERLRVIDAGEPVFEKQIDAEKLTEAYQTMQRASEPPNVEIAKSNQGPPELTPAMIPPLIARYQPKFFADHLDQFVVTRLQHEYWFRKDPAQNTYGVDPKEKLLFSEISTLPDAETRKPLAAPVQKWATDRSNTLGDRFSFRFREVEFRPRSDKSATVAFIRGMIYDSPYTSRAFTSISASESSLSSAVMNAGLGSRSNSDAAQQQLAETKSRFESLTSILETPPSEIYFSTQQYQYLIPNADGERNVKSQQASMGGGISGLPVARPATEPIIPLLRVDKVIQLPKNAAVQGSSEPLVLEVTMKLKGIEIVETPPPHPWFTASEKYLDPSSIRSEIEDQGQYAIIEVELIDARMVGATSGESALPLELKIEAPSR